MITDIFNQKGLSLLELIFVTIVISILVLLSVGQYNRYAVNKDLELVRYNVDEIFQAANQYYWINRDTFSPIADAKTALINLSLWPKLFLVGNKLTPNDSNYGLSFTSISGSDKAVANVTVIFPNAGNQQALLQWYEGKLDATSFDSGTNQLSWSRTITFSPPTSDTNLWIQNTQVQQFRKVVESPP